MDYFNAINSYRRFELYGLIPFLRPVVRLQQFFQWGQ